MTMTRGQVDYEQESLSAGVEPSCAGLGAGSGDSDRQLERERTTYPENGNC
ncbi:hypothetical protein LMG29542_08035 [Paraburkholderia humisilvae]|uniref:Uncharacterized protein n=1 Tax=Paraburkholderia humisilvae TaxID=627669 RepID=A0A6J5FB22_9BURK|nr:hypothetical protein LMG29542_08035 [Paraburkholderia humisilvae]